MTGFQILGWGTPHDVNQQTIFVDLETTFWPRGMEFDNDMTGHQL